MPQRRTLLLTAIASLAIAGTSDSQTATLALSYSLSNVGTDGIDPYGGVIQASDGNLYGIAQYGGGKGTASPNAGTAFRITPAGSFSVIHVFAGGTADGSLPNSLIQLPDGNLYGTSEYGGTDNRGTIFKMTLSGTVTVLYSFENKVTDGDNPYGDIIFDGTYLYGTTFSNDSDAAVAGGTLWKYKPDLGSGSSGPIVLLAFDNSTNAAFGLYPWNGVTDVDGVLYGTSYAGAEPNCGTVWSAAAAGGDNQVLYTFTNSRDGCSPYASPRYYSDGNLYGTTNQYETGTYAGSVWHSGLQANEFGYNTAFTADTYPDGNVTFDGSGNLLFLTDAGGTAKSGAFDLITPAPATPADPNPVTTLYPYPSTGTPGNNPTTNPFIDNEGRVWTEQYYGGNSNSYGGIAAFTVSTVKQAPISITIPATAVAGVSAKIAWAARNAFSTDEQYCFGSGNSSPAWEGHQAGTYASGVYSGSAEVSFSTPGTYKFAITCGGRESALGSLNVIAATTTSLAASAITVNAGSPVTLTATVKKTAGSGVPTGPVSFSVDGLVIGEGTLNGSGVATFSASTAGVASGIYPVIATYSGDAADGGSTSPAVDVTIHQATSTTLAASATSVKIGASVTLTATVSPAGVEGSVNFMIGTTLLATVPVSGGKAVLTGPTAGYPAGTYPIDAVFQANSTYSGSTSNTVNLTLTN